MKREIEKIIVELVRKSLNLPDDYGNDRDGNVIPCVTIRAQDIKLFNTPKMQITVSTVANNVSSNRSEQFEAVDEKGNIVFAERLCLNEQKTIQIDVYSKNNEARERFWEVQACLSSTLAEQMEDKYQFTIGELSTSYNLSGLDGGSNVNRYSIRFNCMTWDEKIIPIDYYDKFRATAQVENEIVFNFDMTKQQ